MDNLLNNLKSLQQLKMSDHARKTGREFLLASLPVESTKTNYSVFRYFRYFLSHPLIIKSLAYVTAVVLVILAGSSYTFSATLNVLPGNTFYPVKLQLEKLQVTMTTDHLAKTKKQIEFTDRRWQEFQTVSDLGVENLDKSEQVVRVARHFNDSLREIKNSLTEVSQQEQLYANDTLDIARLVNDKTIEYEQKLTGEYVDLPISVKSVISKEVEEIKFQSLEILVAKYEQGSAGISRDFLEEQLQNKIISLVEKASSMKAEQQELALKKLTEIQASLENGKYLDVLNLIKNYEQWVTDEQNKATEIEESSTGKVLGEEELLEMEMKVEATNTSTEKTIE